MAVTNKKFKKVSIVTQGEIFGEEEVLEKKLREYTVKCFSSVGELYVLKKKAYLFFLSQI